MTTRERSGFRLWPFWLSLAAVIGSGLVVLAGSGVLLRFILGRTTGIPLSNADQLDLVRIALFITGGLGGIVALVVAYRRQRIHEQAEYRAQQTDRRENIKLFNERFATSGAQLGHEAAAVRMAGVYAMAGLADDWKDQRQTCIDVLCAYLRIPYQLRGEEGHKHGERDVRLSIIRIIRDHLRPGALTPWHGYDFDFTSAVFDGGDFAGAVFSNSAVGFEYAHFARGVTSFRGADFTGGEVSFRAAQFAEGTVCFDNAQVNAGAIRFDHATFNGSRVTFLGTQFAGGEVSFDGAQFIGGEIVFDRAGFTGGRTTFTSTKFAGGEVFFRAVQFAGGDVGFEGVELAGGELTFRRASFTSGEISFRAAQFVAGKTTFDAVELTGGTVAFHDAGFIGGTVTFDNANFEGGTVDISAPEDYRVPPLFEFQDDATPAGLLLPPDGHRRPTSQTSKTADVSHPAS